jgi:hypothetical protein
MSKLDDYKIEFIALKHLSVIWVQSQRTPNVKWARRIADEFDPDKFEPPIVTLPNGSGDYHIVEGQHRKMAVEMLWGPNEMIPCRVLNQTDPARAAEIWLGINEGRKKPRAVPAFKVAVTARREPELSINKLVNRLGFSVAEHKSAETLTAVSALISIWGRNGGELTLSRTLQMVRTLWPGDAAGPDGSILRGLALFLNEFGLHTDSKRMKLAIGRKYTPGQFTAAANARKETTKDRLDEVMADMILREYNRGLPEDKRLRRKKD